MSISVMIQRTFSDKEKAAKLAPIIVKFRSLAAIQPGYIMARHFAAWTVPVNTWLSAPGTALTTGTAGCKANNAWHFKNRSMIYWVK